MDLKQILKHCNHILSHYGAVSQIPKAVEEMSELICELTSHLAEPRPKEKIQDEIADALIMLIQMAELFGLSEVRSRIEFKLDRQNKRILGLLNDSSRL